MAQSRKKENIFVSYFKPFGLKQVCDFIMLIGFVLLIVGLCTNDGVLIAGFASYLVGALASIALCIKVMIVKRDRKKSPEFKSARINMIIMGVLCALALFGLIWTLVA
jgi:hypothetical protein